MAADDKTEQPTAKRRQEARERGQIAKSPEVASALTLAGIFIVLVATGMSLLGKLEQSMASSFELQLFPPGGFTTTFAHAIGLSIAKTVLLDVAPFFAVIIGLSMLANFAQTRLHISKKALQPDLSKLNPISGFKRFVSIRIYVEFGKNLAKLLLVSVIVVLSVYSQWNSLMLLSGASAGEVIAFTGRLVLSIAEKVIAVMLIIAAVDYSFQRHQTTKELKMTKQEVKDEMKQQEMSPHMKGRLRRAARQLALSRMLTDVPKADVVITNPTHYACAIKYDKTVSDAPLLLAKGKDVLAEKIKEIARDNDVPLVENRPLARALYRNVEPGEAIPEELWMTVAEILAYVYQLQRRTDF